MAAKVQQPEANSITEVPDKKTQKQQGILQNALAVFAKEGFRNTDVQVIADRSQVGKGTVYRHFGNKEQLFFATARYCIELLCQFVQSEFGGDQQIENQIAERGTPYFLGEMARACARFYQENPQAIEILIQERADFRESVDPKHLMFREELDQQLEQIIERGMKLGDLRKSNVKAASDAFRDLLFGSLVNGSLAGGKTNLVERVGQSIDLFLEGLKSPDRKSKSGSSKG